MTQGIYAIRNTITGQTYVGSSADLDARGAQHARMAGIGSWDIPKLRTSIKEHGADAFTFEILEDVKDPALLKEREQFWIEKLDTLHTPHGLNAQCAQISETAKRKTTPLNFKVTAEFARAFKQRALDKGLKLNELLEQALAAHVRLEGRE